MTAIHMHFFRDLYAELRASGVLSVTPKTYWWRQNEARKKSVQHGDELVKLVLVMVLKKIYIYIKERERDSHLIKSI